MSAFSKMIGRQFGNPRGFIGAICCKMMNCINNKMYNSVAQEITACENSAILDIGYGNGYLLKMLYKKFNCNLCGIEISTDAEKIAQRRNAKGIKEGKIKLLQSDCCDMPFGEGLFDGVASVNTIYFWEDTLKGLSEVRRVLKDGGKFYNAVYAKEWLQKLSYTKDGFKFFEREDYIRLGKEAGFAEIQIKEIEKDKNFIVVFTR